MSGEALKRALHSTWNALSMTYDEDRSALPRGDLGLSGDKRTLFSHLLWARTRTHSFSVFKCGFLLVLAQRKFFCVVHVLKKIKIMDTY